MIKNQNELPTKLVEKIIQYSSNTGDKVMDMFPVDSLQREYLYQLGRKPLGFEINKKAYEHFKPRFHKKNPNNEKIHLDKISKKDINDCLEIDLYYKI